MELQGAPEPSASLQARSASLVGWCWVHVDDAIAATSAPVYAFPHLRGNAVRLLNGQSPRYHNVHPCMDCVWPDVLGPQVVYRQYSRDGASQALDPRQELTHRRPSEQEG
jgi:hypothetical protein